MTKPWRWAKSSPGWKTHLTFRQKTMYEGGESEPMPSEKLERQLDEVKKDAKSISSLFREKSGSENQSDEKSGE